MSAASDNAAGARESAAAALAEAFKLETNEITSEFTQHVISYTDDEDGHAVEKKFERWKYVKELGQGGFGTVRLEREVETNRLRAVKAIRKDDHGKQLDYARELEAMANLRDWQVLFVAFRGWFENDSQIFIAMEYFELGDLGQHIGEPWAEQRAKLLAVQLLDGLRVMHSTGFTHRDLKPQNIFVVTLDPLWVKLGDFSIAKRVVSNDTALHTRFFSANYTAPEVLGIGDVEQDDYTNACDMWSLGCVLFEVLTARVPFPGGFKELHAYCRKRKPFPTQALEDRGIGAAGVLLLENTLAIVPQVRLSAAVALQQEWLAEVTEIPPEPEDDSVDSETQQSAWPFNTKELCEEDFQLCKEPWALSAITAWLREIAGAEGTFPGETLSVTLSAFFQHYIPPGSILSAKMLAEQVMRDMLKQGALIQVEYSIKFGEASTCGVICELTGVESGCYAMTAHNANISDRCYAPSCKRTTKENLWARRKIKQPLAVEEDWAVHYQLKREDFDGISPSEIERQYCIHEVIFTEVEYTNKFLHPFQTVYRDGIAKSFPPVIPPRRLENFLKKVFGHLDAFIQIQEEALLPQLQLRLLEQGPWIVGISDIYQEWVRRVRPVYLLFANAFPHALMLLRREAERNLIFRNFLEKKREESTWLAADSFTLMKAPITRLNRLSLLLYALLKKFTRESHEKENLRVTIQEIRELSLECQHEIDRMSARIELLEIEGKLIMDPSINKVDLRLHEVDRTLVYSSNLFRPTTTTIVEARAFLFDNYLVLAKVVVMSAANKPKVERYTVSEPPIPISLLVLESADENFVRVNRIGITSTKSTNYRLFSRTKISAKSPSLGGHTQVSPWETERDDDGGDDGILYPFRIKRLGEATNGSSSVVLYAKTPQVRQDWSIKISYCKQMHAELLYERREEPFRLEVLHNQFLYDTYRPGATCYYTPGSALCRALPDSERYAEEKDEVPPNSLYSGRINCSAVDHDRGLEAFGTDHGMHIYLPPNPPDRESDRGSSAIKAPVVDTGLCWRQFTNMKKVSQITVLGSSLLVLAEKSLLVYHLDVIYTAMPSKESPEPKPLQRIKDIRSFTVSSMQGRNLVFCAKKNFRGSTISVLEPAILWTGPTGSFKMFDKFDLPIDCDGLELHGSELVIRTPKDFVGVNMADKNIQMFPGGSIVRPGGRPLLLSVVSEHELVLVYENCAIFVNKQGSPSRSLVVMTEGQARALAAAVHDEYVTFFHEDFIEVKSLYDGRLRQVIAAADVRYLDRSAKYPVIAIAHPRDGRRQLVLKFLPETPITAEVEESVFSFPSAASLLAADGNL